MAAMAAPTSGRQAPLQQSSSLTSSGGAAGACCGALRRNSWRTPRGEGSWGSGVPLPPGAESAGVVSGEGDDGLDVVRVHEGRSGQTGRRAHVVRLVRYSHSESTALALNVGLLVDGELDLAVWIAAAASALRSKVTSLPGCSPSDRVRAARAIGASRVTIVRSSVLLQLGGVVDVTDAMSVPLTLMFSVFGARPYARAPGLEGDRACSWMTHSTLSRTPRYALPADSPARASSAEVHRARTPVLVDALIEADDGDAASTAASIAGRTASVKAIVPRAHRCRIDRLLDLVAWPGQCCRWIRRARWCPYPRPPGHRCGSCPRTSHLPHESPWRR